MVNKHKSQDENMYFLPLDRCGFTKQWKTP